MTTAAIAMPSPAARLVSNVLRRLEAIPFSIVQLVMRVAVGSVFLKAGLLKYQSWELTLMLFRDEYKVPLMPPELSAQMATFNELLFSTLLIVGLGTRLATLPFLGMLVVIQTFVYPAAWTDHLVWASILVTLLVRGGGAISLDHFLSRMLGGASRA